MSRLVQSSFVFCNFTMQVAALGMLQVFVNLCLLQFDGVSRLSRPNFVWILFCDVELGFHGGFGW